MLGVKDIEVADYHYQFYNALAGVVAERWPQDVQERFFRTIREELSAEVHGEVDEKSWHLKQALLRRQTNVRKETKLFREYARQAFEDTLTLYLHGTCCDIDVETGPRQMPSRYLRRRLELLISLYPPPEGYAAAAGAAQDAIEAGSIPILTRGKGDTDFGSGLPRVRRQSESGTRAVADLQTPAHILQSDACSGLFCRGGAMAVLHDDAEFLAAAVLCAHGRTRAPRSALSRA